MMISAAKGLDYHLYGFEASSHWHRRSRQRFAENPRVTCIHGAVANTDSPYVRLYRCTENSVGHSIYSDKVNVDPSSWERTPALRFSEWFRSNTSPGDINVLKVNIEGAEVDLFDDLLASGLAPAIQIYCGTNNDVYKVTSLASVVGSYMKRLHDAGIVIHYFSEHEAHRNCDLAAMISKIV